MRDPEGWYEGRVTEVQTFYRWVKIRDHETQDIYTLDPGYDAVKLELSVPRNKEVRFKKLYPWTLRIGK